MRKTISMMFLMCMITLGANAQLLYKITGKDLQKPSYVIGTYHLASASFADSIPGFHKAMEEVEQVYGEVSMDGEFSADRMIMIQDAMRMPEGKKVTSLFNMEELKRLNAFMTNFLGAGFDNPMVEKQMGYLTPMALLTQFQLITFMKKSGEIVDPQKMFDVYVQKAASALHKPTGGLETIEFQINTLYKGNSLERQAQLLMCLVDHPDFNNQMVEAIIKAFYAQDLDGIKAAMDLKYENACDNTPEEEAALIDNRNANWAKQLPAIMAEKSTLFAVGAAHLPGDKGLLQLLRQAGYTVEGVK